MKKKLLNHIVYKVGDQADWLVYIHGAGGSIKTWNYQVEAFKHKFNTLLIDLRDHGATGQLDSTYEYNFKLITHDILEVLKAHGIERAHFITLSFGSVILQDLSIRYPKLVCSAIFAGGIFRANWAIKSFVYLAKILNVILPYKWMYSLFSFLLMPKEHHQKSRRIYQRQAAKIDPKAYMRWVGLYKEFFELLEQYFHQNIDFPTLVIMGKDDFVFLASAERFVTNQKRAQIAYIPNAGHICNIDQPELFNKVALEFLN